MRPGVAGSENVYYEVQDPPQRYIYGSSVPQSDGYMQIISQP